ncbi:MAG: GNAT family N-acetyltransferase [Acidimicrobiia bacterium]|nr:GNAT family N-acetyltransferase [Acidimicrobiia bacterium]NNC44134.1 GNAT family N-acetyltransferase [Acidimicrobiia bacterium]NND12976.1 GNAT family N-acetyltransferase [Acidimicrobiia bacterium]NNL27896.1 GNAT family N-acetyltransferase [Acidimicrobiia bacterium]NNL46886.1 GNAT family N-acetyltransferase [Acidimicrobiia bacterium]
MLRPYKDDDLTGLLDVWYRASREAHSFLSDQFFEAEQKAIADEWIPIAETTVFESDGRVVGFLSLIGNEVGAIFVDPDYQGNGIGRALMDAASDARPFLELNVFEANTAGRRFYEKYGFELVEEHVDDATGEPELRLHFPPD